MIQLAEVRGKRVDTLTGGHGPDPLADIEAASQKNPLAHGWAYNAVYPPSSSVSAIESSRTSL